MVVVPFLAHSQPQESHLARLAQVLLARAPSRLLRYRHLALAQPERVLTQVLVPLAYLILRCYRRSWVLVLSAAVLVVSVAWVTWVTWVAWVGVRAPLVPPLLPRTPDRQRNGSKYSFRSVRCAHRYPRLISVSLKQLQDMGFANAAQNVRALLATGGNVHSAIEYILNGGGL